LALTKQERDTITRALTNVKANLSAHFTRGVMKEQFCFGSLTRRTVLPRRVNPEADIDYMVVFDNTSRVKPQALIERLKRFAEEFYPRSEIYQSHPTVVLNLSRYRVELVPAHRSWWSGLSIPAKESQFLEWTPTDPEGFERSLREKDEANAGEIRPVIRLLKYWNVVNDHVFDSFALERIVVNHSFWGVGRNLQTRLFSVIESLSSAGLSKVKKERVNIAREVVRRVRLLETHGFAEYAETEVARLIPELR
jgi:hypothetical protein